MSRNPRVTGSDLLVAFAKAGIAVIRVKGSHPVHSGETIGPGLLHKILRDCQFKVDDLQRLL